MANLDNFEILMRRTSENHDTAGPACDKRCARWGDLPHPHLCPDGLYAPTPWLTLTVWCSCGVKTSPTLHYDTTIHGAAELYEAYGELSINAFVAHLLDAHGIDVSTDKAWQRRLGTRP